MKWLNFLHFYQPANQQKHILDAVVAQSYRPILEFIDQNDGFSLSVNFTGALIELFDKYDHKDLIKLIRNNIENGKIELTGSCRFHSFLPLIPEEERIRQIKQNDAVLRHYFPSYRPEGFFSPEMGCYPGLGKLCETLGYKWVIIDEIAYNGGVSTPNGDNKYLIKDTSVYAFFRDRRISNMIMSAVVRNRQQLEESLAKEISKDAYIVTGMDGETFGHHRPGLEKMLFESLIDKKYQTVKISEYLNNSLNIKSEIVEPISSTWASSISDLQKGEQFISWKDSTNPIHKCQWEFTNFTLDLLNKMDKNNTKYEEIRKKMDIGMASDHFWWASAKPWWSLEMIEEGAFRLLDVVMSIPNISKEQKEQAHQYYETIVTTAFNWKRSGKIDKIGSEEYDILRIPFKERTLEKGNGEEGVYYAFIDMMKRLEKEAVEKKEYEKAILWRDALFKIENKLDIYEAIHAIDLLRLEIPNSEVESLIEQYKDKYKRIRGGQPEQRGN